MKYIEMYGIGAILLFALIPIMSTPLPPNQPEDIQIKFWKSPGHAGVGYKWIFSKKSCDLENFNRSEIQSYKCTITPIQMNLLYNTLQKYSIEKISTDSNFFAHDYDAESIEIRWGNNEVSIIQSGVKVRSSDMDSWKKIVEVFQNEKSKLKLRLGNE